MKPLLTLILIIIKLINAETVQIIPPHAATGLSIQLDKSHCTSKSYVERSRFSVYQGREDAKNTVDECIFNFKKASPSIISQSHFQ